MVNRDLDFQVGCVVRSVEMELKELRILLSLYIYISFSFKEEDNIEVLCRDDNESFA